MLSPQPVSPLDQPDLAFTYRFGPYLLDVARRRLLRGSEVRCLPQKSFEILMLLLEANCRVVERRTFFERLWPNDPVGDPNLTQHIFLLRTLLGEHDGDNAYVLTVPGEGYRLAVPVESKVGLAMKGSCDRCGRVLEADSDVYICSYECTFCRDCGDCLDRVCPNCGGEQVRRPRRRS